MKRPRARLGLALAGAFLALAGPSATYLDPFFLESLEVARGPGSVAYGSDALGGVVDARTRRPQPGTPLGMRASREARAPACPSGAPAWKSPAAS